MYTPLAIANDLVLRHPGRGPMGLNKMVYLIQGWTLAVGRPLVGTLPQVWKFGPIHREVYEAFQTYGNVVPTIPQPIVNGFSIPNVPATDTVALRDIDRIVAMYAEMDDLQLSTIAHAPGSPWKIVAEQFDFRVALGTVVPEALIGAHFGRLLQESKLKAA